MTAHAFPLSFVLKTLRYNTKLPIFTRQKTGLKRKIILLRNFVLISLTIIKRHSIFLPEFCFTLLNWRCNCLIQAPFHMQDTGVEKIASLHMSQFLSQVLDNPALVLYTSALDPYIRTTPWQACAADSINSTAMQLQFRRWLTQLRCLKRGQPYAR